MVSEDFAKFFAEVVRHHRKAKKLSQEDLAERADLASKMVSLIELNKRNPNLNVADCVAKGLGVPLWQLIMEAEESRQKKTSEKR